MKTALVMTGGGARAAYQVGCVRALFEILHHKNPLFDIITGNSAGAINATFLAANCHDWNASTQNLYDLWANVRPSSVFDLRKRTITDLGVKWLSGTVLGGLSDKGSSINHLLDTAPLRKLLTREIDFSKLRWQVDQKNLHGFSLSTTNYNTGTNVIFYSGAKEIEDWCRTERFSHRTFIDVDHVMASSAIPFFFPPIQIGESYYGDGCIRQTTPLSPAIHLGANKIIAIGIRYQQEKDKIRHLTFSPFQSPSAGQVAGTLLNAIFLDSLDADVERLHRINELTKGQSQQSLKSIPLLMITPSRDLGKMSTNITSELPLLLKYLLKGIGVSNSEGLDLLSYLAFDPSYTKPLMELGHEDTYKRKEEILRFIETS